MRIPIKIAAGFAAMFLGAAFSAPASAGPIPVAHPSLVSPAPQVEQARYVKRRAVRHRVVRRGRGPGPAAIIGAFGAIMGAAIADSRRQEYYESYPAYGYPAYGYPAYGYAQPTYAYPAYEYRGPAYGYRGHRGYVTRGHVGHFGGHRHFR